MLIPAISLPLAAFHRGLTLQVLIRGVKFALNCPPQSFAYSPQCSEVPTPTSALSAASGCPATRLFNIYHSPPPKMGIGVSRNWAPKWFQHDPNMTPN